MIPDFPNEPEPGNPATAIDLQTVDGVVLRWTFETPVQQSRIMMALGRLFHSLTEAMPELSFPVQEEFLSRPGRPKIVCLCGSTRFKQAFIDANFQQTMLGNIVLSVGWFNHADSHVYTLTPEEKALADRVYKDKIALADEVFVLNVGGYIGESTASEIAHAERLDKPIRYLEPPPGKASDGPS